VNKPTIAYIILLVFFIVSTLVIIGSLQDQIVKLKQEKQVLTQNTLALRDSVRTYITEVGAIYQKYALIQDLNRQKSTELAYRDQTILIQQQSLVALQKQLHSQGNIAIDTMHNTIRLTRVFMHQYIDPSLDLYLEDSIRFIRDTAFNWYGYSDINLKASVKLINRITRDANGFIQGSIEAKSKYLTVNTLETIIDDQYIIPKPMPTTYKVLLSCVGGSNLLAPGLAYMSANNKYIIGLNYNIINPNTWYNKLYINASLIIF